jgi:hypothetical protein
MRFVVASTAEAKLRGLYDNCQTDMIFKLTLKEMGHPQPKTPVNSDNATAVGIANIPSNDNILVQWKCNSFG